MSILCTWIALLTFAKLDTLLADEIPPLWEINMRLRNAAILSEDDDILVYPETGLRAATRLTAKWPSNTVPYVLSANYTQKQKNIITTALAQLQSRTCFKFVARTTQTDYVSIQPLGGCYSSLGKKGGAQTLSLHANCLYSNIVWHEMLHAIGIIHEHQRPDRDNYITVYYQNIESGMAYAFDKVPAGSVDTFGLAYDYNSLMHYDNHGFGKYDNRTGQYLVTMAPKQAGIIMNNGKELTSLDLQKLSRLGNCAGPAATTKAPVASCSDNATNCGQLIAACQIPAYREMMATHCAKTCVYCR